MKLWVDLLRRDETVDFVAVDGQVEHAAVPTDYGDDEEGAGEVTEEAEEPVAEHADDADSAVCGG